MNKQDKELFEKAKKETEINLDIMIQHAPSQEIVMKLLEISMELMKIN